MRVISNELQEVTLHINVIIRCVSKNVLVLLSVSHTSIDFLIIFGKMLLRKSIHSIGALFPLYTHVVNHKKRDILFLTITLATLNRFL